MISQYRLSDLGGSDPRLQEVGGGHLGSGQLSWVAARGVHVTCATKNLIMHLEWEMGEEEVMDLPSSASSILLPSPSQPKSLVSLGKGSPITPRRRVASEKKSPVPPTIPRPRVSSQLAGSPMAGNKNSRSPAFNAVPTGVIKKVPLLTRPPVLISLIDSPEIQVGCVDPLKKRSVFFSYPYRPLL